MDGSEGIMLNLRKLAPTPKKEARTTENFKETEAKQ